ncbi:HEAT repeat domain-containing protein [Pantanalinema rosaneae CENA516]|uniref:HEAT repeat domain-containing protein n=1 Tax=Pantanalinema rosaneae TaxID=1620701 RepID=UPI003D6FCEE2
MANWFSRAEEFAYQGDWSNLSQCLQQRLGTDSKTELTPDDRDTILPLAIQVLQSGDFQDCWEVAKVFPGLGRMAVPALVELLRDEDAELEVRWFAARILGELGEPTAIHALVDLLQTTDDEDLSRIAAEALANLGTSAIAALASLLPQPEARLSVVQALAQIRHSDIIPPLLTVVDDAQPTIRALAIEALSSFHDPQIPPVLVAALSDPVAMVRRAAISGLAVRSELANELNLEHLLADRLWDLNLGVCQQAATALGRLGTDAAVKALFRALQGANVPIALQVEMVRALAWAGTDAALETLQVLLTTPLPSESPERLYQEIVTMLGRWSMVDRQPLVAQTLVEFLNSNHPTIELMPIKAAIALALGQLQQPIAVEPLIQLLAIDDAGVRLHVIAALKQLTAHNVQRRLTEMYGSPTTADALRQGLAIALQEWQVELPHY